MVKKSVVVAVSGAFDPVHAGHIRYLKEAAKLGDKLVVILNDDSFLLKKKGFVFMPFDDRKEILTQIKGVDEVVAAIDTDQTVNKTLELIKPDIFAKGNNGMASDSIPESKVCDKINCQLITNVGGDKVFSNSELAKKVKNSGLAENLMLKLTCPYCDDHPILKERCLYCKGTGKISVKRAG